MLRDIVPGLSALSWWFDFPIRWTKRFAKSPRGAANLLGYRLRTAAEWLQHWVSGREFDPSSVIGRLPPRQRDFSVAVPFRYQQDTTLEPRIAMICHIYYEDLREEVLRYMNNVPFRADVFISTNTDAKRLRIERCFAQWRMGGVEIRVMPNRGRDIAPKLVGFADVYGRYDYVLHLHTKQSFQSEIGSQWRRFIFEHLLGSPEIVRSVFDAFLTHPQLGIVLPQYWERVRRRAGWGDNFELASAVAARMHFKLSRDDFLDFPAGSMFWARSAALRPLLDLRLSFDDFGQENGETDGTLAHAIERLYLFACGHAGFSWLKIAVRSLFNDQDTIGDVESAAVLDGFIRHQSWLIDGRSQQQPREHDYQHR